MNGTECGANKSVLGSDMKSWQVTETEAAPGVVQSSDRDVTPASEFGSEQMRDTGSEPVTKIGSEPMRETGSYLTSASDSIRAAEILPHQLVCRSWWSVKLCSQG